MKNRAELDALLDHLQGMLPKMMVDIEESNFWDAFAGEADAILDDAGPDDRKHVQGRIDCMLSANGLIPGDNEGEACK